MAAWLKFLLPAAASFGASAVTGGKQKTETNQKTTQNTSGTTSSRRFLSGEQSDVMSGVGAHIRQMLADPSAAVAPARTAAVNNVNNTFRPMEQMAKAKTNVAGGKSGRAGRAARELGVARLGAVNDTNLQFDQKVLDLQENAAAMGMNFAGINLGQDGSFNTNSEGTMTGTTIGTPPGGPLGQGVAGGLQTLATLMALQRMMGGGGGGDVSSSHPGFWGG